MITEVDNNAVLRLVLYGTYNSVVEIRNVFEYRLVTGGPIVLAGVIDDFEEVALALLDEIAAVQATIMSWRAYSVATLNSSWVTGEIPFTAPITGLDMGDSATSSLAALVSLPTGVPRRILKKFVGPLAEQLLTGSGNLNPTGNGLIQQLGDLLLVDFEAANGLWRYGHAIGDPSEPTFLRPIGATVRTVLSPMTRRKQGVGI
jgi:hypothetical protein